MSIAMEGENPQPSQQGTPRYVISLSSSRILLTDLVARIGIAIVAHLFSVPLLSPQQIAAQPSPFDDPFSSSVSSGADMCLGLEMMRGGDLKVLGEVDIGCKWVETLGAKGKGKGKERVEVETPTDVRVYVDQRCPETVGWFEDTFCRDGRQGIGVRVDVGGAFESSASGSAGGLTPSLCRRFASQARKLSSSLRCPF